MIKEELRGWRKVDQVGIAIEAELRGRDRELTEVEVGEYMRNGSSNNIFCKRK